MSCGNKFFEYILYEMWEGNHLDLLTTIEATKLKLKFHARLKSMNADLV